MSIQAQLVIILWLPIVIFIFSQNPPRKAVIMSFLGGFLFLPQKAGFPLPLIPDYGGITATCYGVLMGIGIFDRQKFSQLKLSWVDIPIILFCFSNLFSSITNGLGVYDGINQSIVRVVEWGLPYFIGRLYFTNLQALKELAIGIVKGGLIYVPLCLFEVRFSPQLHNMVYGYFPHSFAQTIRYGGFRPQVFMEHGLMVGAFMMIATLTSLWLWQGKVVQQIWSIPIPFVFIILFVTLILVKSTNAYLLLFLGLIILFTAKIFRTSLPLILLICGIVSYLTIASSGFFAYETALSRIPSFIPSERVQSLEFRLKNEELLSAKARQKIIFGWGGWGRNVVIKENWRGEEGKTTITDSFWIIVFGINGLFGLYTYILMMTLPVLMFNFFCYPPRSWFNPQVASVAVLAVSSILFLVDTLFNAMFNPLIPLINGSLVGLYQLMNRHFSYRQIKMLRISQEVSGLDNYYPHSRKP